MENLVEENSVDIKQYTKDNFIESSKVNLFHVFDSDYIPSKIEVAWESWLCIAYKGKIAYVLGIDENDWNIGITQIQWVKWSPGFMVSKWVDIVWLYADFVKKNLISSYGVDSISVDKSWLDSIDWKNMEKVLQKYKLFANAIWIKDYPKQNILEF